LAHSFITDTTPKMLCEQGGMALELIRASSLITFHCLRHFFVQEDEMLFVKGLWLFVFAVDIALIFLKCWIGSGSSKEANVAWFASTIIFLAALLLIMFMLEGIQLSVAQLRSTDDGGLKRFFRNKGIDLPDAFVAFIDYSRANFTKLLEGQQIITIIIVVVISKILDSLEVGRDHYLFTAFNNTIYGLGDATYLVLSNQTACDILLAAMLPCWISQLFPQLLAERGSIEFMRTGWLARMVLYLGVLASKIEAGYPSRFLHWLTRMSGRFTEEDKIPASEEAVFDTLAANFGFQVDAKEIAVCVHHTAARVSERNVYRFATAAQIATFRHSMLLNNHGGLSATNFQWVLDLPEGIDEPEIVTKPMTIKIYGTMDGDEPGDIGDEPNAPETTTRPAEGPQEPLELAGAQNEPRAQPDVGAKAAENAEGVVPDELPLQRTGHEEGNGIALDESTYLYAEADLSRTVPRPDLKSETIAITANYRVQRAGPVEELLFEVPVPTKFMAINISNAPNVPAAHCVEPTVTFEVTDPAAGLVTVDYEVDDTQLRVLGDATAGWRVEIYYPPLRSRARLRLAA
jgi:hypothetical protein